MSSRIIVNQLLACGIGDYIRGCIVLEKLKAIFKQKYNFLIDLTFDISNHPISKLLDDTPYSNASKKTPTTAIGFFKSYESLLIPFILNTKPNTTSYVSTNASRLDRILKNKVNMDSVKSIFTPSAELLSLYNKKLYEHGLSQNSYIILSIRIGDMAINNPWYGEKQNIQNIFSSIEKNVLPFINDKKVVIISDCIYLKRTLCKAYNFINLETKASCFHRLNYFNSLDTLIDIFLIRDCIEIFGLLSGFTIELARVFDKNVNILPMYVTLENGRSIKIPVRSRPDPNSSQEYPKHIILDEDNFYLDNSTGDININ